MRCAMTGQPLRDYSDGIYDDGEWISWDLINGHIADQELRGEFPNANLEVVKIFQKLLAPAETYKYETGRYLQIWGELGGYMPRSSSALCGTYLARKGRTAAWATTGWRWRPSLPKS